MSSFKSSYRNKAPRLLRNRKRTGILDRLLIPVTIASSCIYITWRILFTVPFGYGSISMVLGIFLLVVEIIGMFEAAIHFYSMSDIESPEKPEADEALFPDVDIFIATYNEPEDLLYKTINGCVHMDYPDKSKIHVYLCDDGNRETVKRLADRMKVGYITRTERKHAKAGNLNHAMTVTSSPLIVTLDADMIPMSNFLTSCVPYFLTGEKLGFLQTPQSFYNLDLFQYYLYSEDRIPNEQDYFYKTVQTSRNKINSVIYGGSNTIISRAALDEIGGFVTDVITEDFATGMAIQSKGYTCLAIDKVHASGLSPEDLKSLIKQRERWARGCIQSGRKLNILFRKGLNLKQKMSYMSSITYWYSSFKRLAYFISPIAFALFGIVVVRCTFAELFFFWLPMYVLNRICVKRLSNNARSSKWSNVFDTILFPSLLPVVLIESLGLTKTTFAVTRKDGVIENDKRYQINHAIPHILLGLLTLAGIVYSVGHIFITGSVRYLYIIFWLLANLYNILMSVFFMLGRPDYPEEKKAAAAVDCAVITPQTTFRCVTDEIWEQGLSFYADVPKYYNKDVDTDITLISDKYISRFKAKITGVKATTKGFKHVFNITDIKEHDYRQLLGLIYDRVPTITRSTETAGSSFDDIRINITKRFRFGRRKADDAAFPRISVNREFVTSNDDKVYFIDFYYNYISILGKDAPFEFSLKLGLDVRIDCSFYEVRYQGDAKISVYSITNLEEVANRPELEKIISVWMEEEKNIAAKRKEQPEDSGLNAAFDEFDEMLYV